MKILLMFVVCVVCNCGSEHSSRALDVSPTPPSSAGTQSTGSSSTIDSAEFERWKALGIVNYDMTISLETTSFLEPARAVIVKVRNASPTSIEVADEHDRRGRLGFYGP